jgi:thymidylate synthase
VSIEILSGRDIGDTWFAAYHACLEYGRTYTIDRGSFAGQQRKQLDMLTLRIEHPENRPLGVTLGSQPISDDESVHRYFEDYLVNSTIAPNEAYTYASRITPYLERVAAMLRETPGTNQATIEVARSEDILLLDPPCLRVLSWKITPRGLQLTSFWRSWDIYGALATNLGGLQLLNELVAEWAELTPGALVAYSDGAHVYDYAW